VYPPADLVAAVATNLETSRLDWNASHVQVSSAQGLDAAIVVLGVVSCRGSSEYTDSGAVEKADSTVVVARVGSCACAENASSESVADSESAIVVASVHS